MPYQKPLTILAGLSIFCSVAVAGTFPSFGISPSEAAASIIKPFVGAASLRGNFDAFMHITMNIAHDVAHPTDPEMFGAQPGFIRVLEALQSPSGYLSDTCELAGSYRIERLHGEALENFDDDTDRSYGIASGLHVARLTYDGCRLNRYGIDSQLDGDITFYLIGQPVEGQIAVRGVQFGSRRWNSGRTAYVTSESNSATQELEGVHSRSYGVFGAIPTTLDEQLGFLSGKLRVRIDGEIRSEFKYRNNNEVYDGKSLVTAQNVHVHGKFERGTRLNPTTGSMETASTQIIDMLTGEYRGSFDAVIASQTNLLRSFGLKLEDIEFDSDSGSHYLSYDGRGIVTNSAAAPTCNLGAFSVDTKRPLYVPYFGFDPMGGSMVVDNRVRADFRNDGAVVIAANDQQTEYVDFNEVRQTAQCFIY